MIKKDDTMKIFEKEIFIAIILIIISEILYNKIL